MGAGDAEARAERARLLHESRKQATDRKANEAIDGLVRAGERVSFRAVAARAGLSTATLYGHPEVRARIESLRDSAPAGPAPQPRTPGSDAAVVASLRRKMKRLEEENRALREENRRLSEAASRSYADYMESL